MSEPALVERCPHCQEDTGAIPSDPESHSYGVSELGDLLSHVSRVTCSNCGTTLMRRHAVPFIVRG